MLKKKGFVIFKRSLQSFIQVNVLIRRKRSIASTSDDFFDKTFQFKYQRSIVELKLMNLNFYYNKNIKSLRNEFVTLLTHSELICFIFLTNKKKSIKHKSICEKYRYNVEIITRKKFKNCKHDLILKKIL